MAATGENSSISCAGVYGSSTLDRSDPFDSEGNGTAKFIGTGMSKFDFHTMKPTNAVTSKRSNQLELSKSELVHMLCCLEGELQARDVVIAALRNDRVKHYIHALRSKNLSLDDPQAALFRDKAAISGNHVSRQSSTAAIQAEFEIRAIIEQQMDSLCQVVTKQRHTQVRMVNVLSDSLENNQRMRQELEEEKRKHEHDTAQGDDITYGLEMERTKLKQELEAERLNRKKLEKDLKKSQEILDFERGRQKQIVLLLLAERKKIIMKYIEERKRSEDLAQILSEEKLRSDSIAEGLEEESKKSLRMEAELEKQILTIETERKAWKLNLAKDEKRLKDIEIEVIQLRNENDAFRKQMSIRMTNQITTGPGCNVSTLSNKIRAVPDDVTAAVVSSSIINVAKIVQPTATVSSVPVSGPTTGIARSISPGQCLRQQSTDLIGGGANSNLSTTILFNVPPAKVTTTPRKLSNSAPTTTAQPPGSIILSNSTGIDLATSKLLPAAAAAAVAATITTTTTTTTTPTNQSTILRSGATSSPPIIGMVGVARDGSGRGMPPPIPPNKPIVPPKREPSISRICGPVNVTNPVPLTTQSSSSSSSSSPLPAVAVLTNNNQICSNPPPPPVSNSSSS